MKKNSKAFVFIMAALLLCACGSKNKTEKQETDLRPTVRLAEVHSRPVAQIQEYTATVEAEAKNNIAPSVPVRIDSIWVEVGDRVKAGQRLVSMDEANLKQMALQLHNKRTEFERTDELYKIGGVSKSEWDAVKLAYEVQQTAYGDLKRNTALVSPIDGMVTARNYDNGDLYSGAAPVLVVEQIVPVKLKVNVSEDRYTQVVKGGEVEVRLEVYGDRLFQGRVSLVYPTVNAKTHTFPVEIEVRNHDQLVRPGMFARATLNFGEQVHVVVPDLAVVKQHGSGDNYVYVYRDGKVYYNKVTLGRRLGDEYEVVAGVPDRAQVVVAGQSRLADGIDVKVQE